MLDLKARLCPTTIHLVIQSYETVRKEVVAEGNTLCPSVRM
jgi:hypothetical protein